MVYGKDPVRIKCRLCDCSFELRADVFFKKDDIACPNCGIDSRGKFAPFRESLGVFFEKKEDLHRIFEFDLGL